jgi:hypothetical protein
MLYYGSVGKMNQQATNKNAAACLCPYGLNLPVFLGDDLNAEKAHSYFRFNIHSSFRQVLVHPNFCSSNTFYFIKN